MKNLTSEAQADLRDLLEKLDEQGSFDIETSSRLDSWKIELKPKRVRRLPRDADGSVKANNNA